jgi:hypothetical protein
VVEMLRQLVGGIETVGTGICGVWHAVNLVRLLGLVKDFQCRGGLRFEKSGAKKRQDRPDYPKKMKISSNHPLESKISPVSINDMKTYSFLIFIGLNSYSYITTCDSALYKLARSLSTCPGVAVVLLDPSGASSMRHLGEIYEREVSPLARKDC